jgi:hypothetical protein
MLHDPEALFYLLTSRAFFALAPYRRIVRWMTAGSDASAMPSPEDLAVALTIKGRLAVLIQRFPALGPCVPHAMAALAMLRSRNIRGEVHFGVLRNPPSGLPIEAHIWVTVGDVIVAGESVMSAFVELSSFS